MNKSYFYTIIALMSCTVLLAGCGEDKKANGMPSENAAVSSDAVSIEKDAEIAVLELADDIITRDEIEEIEDNEQLWSAVEQLAYYSINHDKNLENADDLAAAVFDITGHEELSSDYFGKEPDRQNMESSYLFESSIANRRIEKLADGKYDVKCDMFWMPASGYEVEGLIRLHVVLIKNKTSSLDGMSIYKLYTETILDPVETVMVKNDFEEFGYEEQIIDYETSWKRLWENASGAAFTEEEKGTENTLDIYILGEDCRLDRVISLHKGLYGEIPSCELTDYRDGLRTIAISETEFDAYLDICRLKTMPVGEVKSAYEKALDDEIKIYRQDSLEVNYGYGFVDEDEIPELFIVSGEEDTDTVTIYTYNEETKEAVYLGNFGENGRCYYVPYENKIVAFYYNKPDYSLYTVSMIGADKNAELLDGMIGEVLEGYYYGFDWGDFTGAMPRDTYDIISRLGVDYRKYRVSDSWGLSLFRAMYQDTKKVDRSTICNKKIYLQ